MIFFRIPDMRKFLALDREHDFAEIKVVRFPALWQMRRQPLLNWYSELNEAPEFVGKFAGRSVRVVSYWAWLLSKLPSRKPSI